MSTCGPVLEDSTFALVTVGLPENGLGDSSQSQACYNVGPLETLTTQIAIRPGGAVL